jgi:pimeloyl-ACP methyl ester carboxylesterase
MSEIKPELLSQEVGDATLNYVRFPGDGPTLVAAHAAGFVPWLWGPVANELAGKCEIIAPCFYGYRKLEPSGAFSWLQMATDLTNLCEQLNLKNPFLMGHSMGGVVVSIAKGAVGLPAPKMLLFEPMFLPEHFHQPNFKMEDEPLALQSLRRKNHWEDEQAVREYLLGKELFQSWDPEALEVYIQFGFVPAKDGGLKLACSPEQEASHYLGGRCYNPWPMMRTIQCPVLVVEGEKSVGRDEVNFKQVSDTFPNGKHILVKDAGHLIVQEMPKVAAQLIRDFLLKD